MKVGGRLNNHEVKPRNIFGEGGELLAVFIPGNYTPDGIEFITEPTNTFQVAVMKRSPSTPAVAHFHNNLCRNIFGTQEYLLVRKGTAIVKLLDFTGKILEEVQLNLNDSVLLVAGGHEISFSEDCVLLEVKQGPYDQNIDKSPIIISGNGKQ